MEPSLSVTDKCGALMPEAIFSVVITSRVDWSLFHWIKSWQRWAE